MTVCDLCKYEIPSSCDGKPCTMCPAETNTEIQVIPLSVVEEIREKIENQNNVDFKAVKSALKIIDSKIKEYKE